MSKDEDKKKTFHGLSELEHYQHPDLFGEFLGYKIKTIDRENHAVTGYLKIEDKHLSLAGRVHGGVVTAFMDATCGAAALSTLSAKDFTSTVELKVNFLKPLDLDDELFANAEVVFRGKRLCVIHARMFKKGSDKAIAIATGTFNIIQK